MTKLQKINELWFKTPYWTPMGALGIISWVMLDFTHHWYASLMLWIVILIAIFNFFYNL